MALGGASVATDDVEDSVFLGELAPEGVSERGGASVGGDGDGRVSLSVDVTCSLSG